MAALGEARVKMDAQLLDIKFIDIKDSGKDKREVTTEEKWIYKYTGLDSNKTTDNSSGRYRIKYNLEKRSGNWLITDISVIKAEEDNKNQEIFDRPAEKGKSKN